MLKKPFLLLCLLFYAQFGFSQRESLGNLYNFYQKYISDIRPSKCPMYPSCSNFAMDSFKNYSILRATLHTTDRLLRCGHDHDTYDLVSVEGHTKLFDPAILTPEALNHILKVEKLYSVTDSAKDLELQLFLRLIDEGHYSEAISEYYRISLTGLEVDLKVLEYNYYRALFGLGEFEKVIFHFENKINPLLREDEDIKLKVSEAWFKLNQYEASLNFLSSNFKSKTNQSYLLEGLNYAYLDDFSRAHASFSSVESSFIYADYANRNKEISLNLAQLKLKSPTTAGVLGLIPGLGYVYSGSLTTGLSALLLNGLLGYATYTSFDTGNTGVGILSGVFTSAFYFGSISGGIKATKRTNEHKKNNFKRRLKYSFN